MKLAIEVENDLLEELKELSLETNQKLEDFINSAIKEHYKKIKTELLAQKIYRAYKEAKEAHEKGIKLQSVDELLQELN
ncbi:MAG: hypothetical protein GXO62_07860 [Epsilonproteobacteria bacterium]|nr:hypothetical protein [Campylobacterota bacterium]